ncbi:hypothetical protein ACFL96_18565 [Thermoproteota archaeon]
MNIKKVLCIIEEQPIGEVLNETSPADEWEIKYFKNWVLPHELNPDKTWEQLFKEREYMLRFDLPEDKTEKRVSKSADREMEHGLLDDLKAIRKAVRAERKKYLKDLKSPINPVIHCALDCAAYKYSIPKRKQPLSNESQLIAAIIYLEYARKNARGDESKACDNLGIICTDQGIQYKAKNNDKKANFFFSKAESFFKESIDYNNFNAMAYYNYGVLLERLDRLEEAKSMYEISLKKSHTETAEKALANLIRRLARV